MELAQFLSNITLYNKFNLNQSIPSQVKFVFLYFKITSEKSKTK